MNTGSYKKRPDPFGYCYTVSSNHGYSIFALQYGGQCLAGTNLSYQNFGKSNSCNADGRGGFLANEVYSVEDDNLNGEIMHHNAETKVYLLDINFQLNYNSSLEPTVNATWQFFMAPFITVQYEYSSVYVVKIDANKFKYKISNLTSNGVNQTISFTINNTQCLIGDIYNIDIPIKLSFQNTKGSSWNTFKTIRKQVNKKCSNTIVPMNPNHVPEYYGRGVYWDDTSLQIYFCMNQYVTTLQKPACLFSKDNGSVWKAMDMRIGAVLGHRISNRELYAVHRNQKLYLMFHDTYKKWLAVTNREFEIKISKDINWTQILTLERNCNQVVTFGGNEWMGNEEGLFFRKQGNSVWTQRFNWNV